MRDREKLHEVKNCKALQNYQRLIFATFYQRFRQRIYLKWYYATLYQRFKQGIYMMLNYAMVTLRQLTLRVYIVDCPQLIPNKRMINKHKMHPASQEIYISVILFPTLWEKYFVDVMMIMMTTVYGEKINAPSLSPRYYKFYHTFTVLFPEWDNVRLI